MVGSGAREHAIVWKLAQSSGLSRIYAAPGNPGIAEYAECVPWSGDIDALADWSEKVGIELTIVGPEAPLVAGLADRFRARGLVVFGPTRAAARIEGSKAYAKSLMRRYAIPTAAYRSFRDLRAALAYLDAVGVPIVVKDSGLAAGKGVTVADTLDEARAAVNRVLGEGKLDDQSEVVIEEYLEGQEITLLAVTDGRTVRALLPSQDHKRLLEHDQGPNTGGMGAICPLELPEGLAKELEHTVLEPLIHGLSAEGIEYQGVIYAGLILTTAGPKVLEFNVRFGDPEMQVILPLLRSDLLGLARSVTEGRLAHIELAWRRGAAAAVVLAAPGYPMDPREGLPIWLPESPLEGVLYFHGATREEQGGGLVSNGGRILTVVGMGEDLEAALRNAYQGVGAVRSPELCFRRDIGARAIAGGLRRG